MIGGKEKKVTLIAWEFYGNNDNKYSVLFSWQFNQHLPQAKN
jgi:hypothetical protein